MAKNRNYRRRLVGWLCCRHRSKKTGAEVEILERTDLLLGLGNVGGIMRNNGRFTATEENIAMGADELFLLLQINARPTKT